MALILVLAGCRCETKTVAHIGSCQAHGRFSVRHCSVTYTDGTQGAQHDPIVGLGARVCRSRWP